MFFWEFYKFQNLKKFQGASDIPYENEESTKYLIYYAKTNYM